MGKKGNILAVMSAKGGTGKTATTANLAYALSNDFNRKILAIDTNITTASLAIHFGIDKPRITMYDVLKKEFPIESAIVEYTENLHIIPASLICLDKEENNKEIFSIAEKIKKLAFHYDILLSQIAKKYDIVVLDSAPGFTFESLANFQIADGILFVTNSDYPTLFATSKALSYAKYVNVPMGGVILNKVAKRKYELNSVEIEKLIGAKIAAKIPLDENIPESIAIGKPVTLCREHCPASIAYKELAGMIIGESYSKTALERLKWFLKGV